ncbi:ubiquitin-like superfamily protein [Striga asiatica]|uniref:Ubiquitin-like superfamily protein n=1 Tax=Striga asiatica TaxID=4170 RepID=A0A5A7Q728_STRAF|nr:ubiquitin-like superfamily protein [Striga asiatica]
MKIPISWKTTVYNKVDPFSDQTKKKKSYPKNQNLGPLVKKRLKWKAEKLIRNWGNFNLPSLAILTPPSSTSEAAAGPRHLFWECALSEGNAAAAEEVEIDEKCRQRAQLLLRRKMEEDLENKVEFAIDSAMETNSALCSTGCEPVTSEFSYRLCLDKRYFMGL